MKVMKKVQKNKIVIAVMFFVVMIVAVFTENSVDSMTSHCLFQAEGTYKINAAHNSKKSYIDETYTLDQKVPINFISMTKQNLKNASVLLVRRLHPFERRELLVCFYSVLAILFKIAIVPNFIFILLFMILCSFFYARNQILRCMYERDGKKEAAYLFF